MGTKIDLVVSMGPSSSDDEDEGGLTSISVPDVTGMDYDDALVLLEGMGLTVERGEDVATDILANGTVAQARTSGPWPSPRARTARTPRRTHDRSPNRMDGHAAAVPEVRVVWIRVTDHALPHTAARPTLKPPASPKSTNHAILAGMPTYS